MWRKGNSGTLVVEIQIDTTVRKNSMEVLLKFKIKLPCDLDIPLLRHLSKGIEIRITKQYLNSHVNCSTIHNSKDMKTT